MAICPPTGLGELPQVEITVARAIFLLSFNQILSGVNMSSTSAMKESYKI